MNSAALKLHIDDDAWKAEGALKGNNEGKK